MNVSRSLFCIVILSFYVISQVTVADILKLSGACDHFTTPEVLLLEDEIILEIQVVYADSILNRVIMICDTSAFLINSYKDSSLYS